jgi:DNA-binding LacI/PurR family transcriptional regulator
MPRFEPGEARAGAGRQPTLVDVAEAAGVSRATASRVLAGAATVDRQMAESVRTAAKRLGYRPNVAARRLAGGRSGSIAIVMGADDIGLLAGAFLAPPLRGATTVLADADVQPVLLMASDKRLPHLAEHLGGGHVDGAIVVLQHGISAIASVVRDLGLPVAYMGRPVDLGADSRAFVECDNYGGGRLAARRLIEAGRRRLAMITGPADVWASSQRLEGWRDEVAEHRLDGGDTSLGDFGLDSGSAAMARLLSRRPDVDGVFAANDLMAVGAFRVLDASGRRVPTDVSVVGFDDSVVATTSDPPLTSIRQPLEEMGRAAAQLLLEMLGGAGDVGPRILPTSLIERESV